MHHHTQPKRAERIPVSVPVIVRQGDGPGVRARSRDVSASGAFIELPALPKSREELLLEFACGRIFLVRGTVARVDDGTPGIGVAFDQEKWHPELRADFIAALRDSRALREGAAVLLRSAWAGKKLCPACDYTAPAAESFRKVCPECFSWLK